MNIRQQEHILVELFRQPLGKEMFFSSESNMRAIGSFMREAKISALNDSIYTTRLERSLQIVSVIYKNPQAWSERCGFNIEWIGEKFIHDLNNFKADETDLINSIYTDSYRFLCEYDFFIGAGRELGFELQALKSSIQNDALKLDSDISSQIIFASYVMPAQITKRFVNSEGLGAIRSFTDKVNESKALKEQWDAEISEKSEVLDALRQRLDNISMDYNFVGLYKGFHDLSVTKHKERKLLLRTLIGLAFLILTPLFLQFWFTNTKEAIIPFSWSNMISFAPLVSVELVLIYFFRIVLHNYKAVKTQIMQIELRQTLCQFIQSYSDYSKEIRQANPAALDKFEAIIFSGIMSDSDKLPSTFEGFEQIGALVKSMKAG